MISQLTGFHLSSISPLMGLTRCFEVKTAQFCLFLFLSMSTIKGELTLPGYFMRLKFSAMSREGVCWDSGGTNHPKVNSLWNWNGIVLFFFGPDCLHRHTLHAAALRTSPELSAPYLNSYFCDFIHPCGFKYHLNAEVGTVLSSELGKHHGCLTSISKLTHPLQEATVPAIPRPLASVPPLSCIQPSDIQLMSP